eukprot:5065449-Pyramimonas_sp.AAC.1
MQQKVQHGFMSPLQDLATESGFKQCLHTSMRLKSGGVLWFSPPYCGTPVEDTIENVPEAKREEYIDIAKKVCFLSMVAVRRQVTIIVEAALESWFWKCPLWQNMARSHGMYCSDLVWCAYSDDEPCNTFQHHVRLMGTEWWVGVLGSKCEHGEGVHPRRRLVWLNEIYPPKLADRIVETYDMFARTEVPDPGPVPYHEASSDDFSLGMKLLETGRPRKLARMDSAVSAVSEKLSAPLTGLSDSDEEPDKSDGMTELEQKAFFMTSTPKRDQHGKFTQESMD